MRRLLQEAEGSNDLAAFITKINTGYKTAVVYDAKIALEPGGSKPIWEKSDTFLGTKLIKGLISITQPDSPCWGASEVKFSAGKGLGKTIYNLGYAMSPSRKLIPDRSSVSQDARDAWAGVFKGNKLKRYHLDNKDKKRTPEPEDDCSVHDPDDKNNPLNYAYEGGGDSMSYLGTLRAGHSNVLSQIPKDKKEDFLGALERGLAFFWKNNYPGGS